MLHLFATEIKPLQLDLGNASGRNETMRILTFILFLFQSLLIASNITFGTIKDSLNNNPLEGVNVTSGQNGISTDKKGQFIIDAESGFLEISHIGYKSLKIPARDTVLVFLIDNVVSSKEIVVLSSLSETNLSNSSASVAVFEKNDIKSYNYEHFQDLINHVPNLNFAGGTSRPRYFQIRGIGERSQYFGEGSPNHSVSYEIDGIDLSGIGMIGSTIDIDQIEVVRGPQSTIFGNNSIAGAINLFSAEPERKNLVKLDYKTGNDNLKHTAAIINLNVLKDLFLRFSFFKKYQDGFRNNKFFDLYNTNKRDETFARFKINFSLTENILLKNTIMLSNMDNGYDAWAPDNNKNFETFSDQPGKDSQKTKAIASKLLLNFNKFRAMVKFSSSISDLVHSYDGDWGNNAFWEDSTTYGFDSYYYGYYLPYQYFDKTTRLKKNTNSELRLYNKNAVIGLYFKNLEENDDAEGYLFGGEGNITSASSNYDINVQAIYAQLNSELNNNISLSNSFRYELNDISYLGKSYGYGNDSIPLVTASKSFNLNGFKSSIVYNLSNSTKLFAHISYGYKTGGVNQQPYVSNENKIYKPEYLGSYEISFKNNTKNHFTSLSYFYNDRIDQQVSISAQQNESDPNSFYYFTTNNEGEGYSRGLEFDLKVKIFNNISLKTSLAYLDTWTSRFSYNISENEIQIGGGREAAMAPKISSSISLAYDHNLFSLALSQNYKDKYYFSDSHDLMSDSYSITNFSVSKVIENFKISFWAKNIFDERYAVRGFYFGLIPPNYEDKLWISYGDPKQVGVSIRFSFNDSF